jgi:hypothetical protein
MPLAPDVLAVLAKPMFLPAFRPTSLDRIAAMRACRLWLGVIYG